MYVSHYNLNEKPFKPTTDPRFIWLSESQTEKLRVFRHTFLNQIGFLRVRGDIGCGKTAFFKCFLHTVRQRTICALIRDTLMEPLDFLNCIAMELNFNKVFDSRDDFLGYYSRFAGAVEKKNLKLLIAVDEAQNLSPDLYQELKYLSEIKVNNQKLLSVFLIQQETAGSTNLPQCNPLSKHSVIADTCLAPYSQAETHQLITHRLKVAGAKKQIFSLNAIAEIFEFSAGNPRLITMICDHALLTGYAAGKTEIDKFIIEECAQELQLAA